MYALDKLSVYVEKRPINFKTNSNYQIEENVSNLGSSVGTSINSSDANSANINKIINTISINNRFSKNSLTNNNLSTKLDESNICNFVTRNNYALFTSQIHLECKKPLLGRYIYIQADGRNNRWSRLFSAVFCEIQAYEV